MRVMLPHRAALHCYACGKNMDIFDVAHTLENKPLDGVGFITENVNYLSNLFGLPEVKIILTPEMEAELRCERAHRIAGSIYTTMLTLDRARARGWDNPQVLTDLGIGTIENRDEFFERVARDCEMSIDELWEVGIEQRFFGPDKLTFLLKNIRGACIGFASRDLDYENKVAKGIPGTKYINPSHDRNTVYRKNGYVYNLDRARDRNQVPFAIVMEGYADVVALEIVGIRGGVAVGGTAMSAEHVSTMIKAGIRSVILAMDYDFTPGKIRAGQDGMMRAIEVLRAFPEIRVRVIDWARIHDTIKQDRPELLANTTKFDIDWMAQQYGGDALMKILRAAILPVTFKIRELKTRGLEDRDICEQTIPDIAAIPDELLVQDYTQALATDTGYDYDLLLDRIKRERSLRNSESAKQVDDIKRELDRAYARTEDIGSKVDLLLSMATRAADIDPRQATTSVECELRAIERIENEADGIITGLVAQTGIVELDEDLGGGLPLGGKLILIGGRPHVGKTQFQQRLAVNVLEMNPDVDVLVWTLDDDQKSWTERIWSALSGLPIYKCQRPQEYMQHNKPEQLKYKAARDKVRHWISHGRLKIQDASGGNDISTLEALITYKARQERPFIVFFDNFHKTSGASDRQRLESTAERVKNLTQKFNVPIVANAELRKREASQTEAPRPPSEDDLKETGKLHYDADYIILIDSPLTRMPYRPEVINAKDGKPFRSYRDIQFGCWQAVNSNVDLPVLHLLRVKNKVFNMSGASEKRILLNFDPRVVQFYPVATNDNSRVIEIPKDWPAERSGF